MIPRRIIRSVPEQTSDQVEDFWRGIQALHPGWEFVTFRDPLPRAAFPLTSPWWPRCQSGAQLAGLVRLEALWASGGIWCDSDYEGYRPFTPLLGCEAFAAWEDANVVPDAVMGSEAGHPAIKECIVLALARIQTESQDWQTGNGAWATGPGVTTAVLPGRDDVTLLGPESFYPVHYTEKERLLTERHWRDNPATYGVHHWAASWL